jgi:hypothetical protein
MFAKYLLNMGFLESLICHIDLIVMEWSHPCPLCWVHRLIALTLVGSSEPFPMMGKGLTIP